MWSTRDRLLKAAHTTTDRVAKIFGENSSTVSSKNQGKTNVYEWAPEQGV